MSVAINRKPYRSTLHFSLGLLLLLLLSVFSCGHERSSEPTGGETHFLTHCAPGSTACGSGLSCLCGVCTRACDARAACQSLSDAACVPSSEATCAEAATGHCDVACVSDDDCAILSASHRCESGLCRAGANAPRACAHGEVAANQ